MRTPVRKTIVAAWKSVEGAAKRSGFQFFTPSRPGLAARNPKNDNGAEFTAAFQAFDQGQAAGIMRQAVAELLQLVSGNSGPFVAQPSSTRRHAPSASHSAAKTRGEVQTNGHQPVLERSRNGDVSRDFENFN